MAQARDLRPGEAFTAKHALGSEGELLEVRVACATVDVIEEGTRKVDRFVALKPAAAADAAADVVPDTPAPDSLATALADAERLGLSPRKDDPAARKALVERMVRAMEADKDAAVTAIAEVGAGHRAVQDGVVVRAQLLLAAALQATPKMPWAGREVVQTTRRLARTLADAPAWEPKRATWLQMLVTTLGSLPKGTAGVATALAEADRAVKRDTRANSSLVAALAAAKRAHGSAE